MWEFASVMQYIHTFGKAVKLDNDFDIQVRASFTASFLQPQQEVARPYKATRRLTTMLQDFEEECVKPDYSEKLESIGLTLLKWISSFRGLE